MIQKNQEITNLLPNSSVLRKTFFEDEKIDARWKLLLLGLESLWVFSVKRWPDGSIYRDLKKTVAVFQREIYKLSVCREKLHYADGFHFFLFLYMVSQSASIYKCTNCTRPKHSRLGDICNKHLFNVQCQYEGWQTLEQISALRHLCNV